jgi:hypothetical protein
VKTKITMHNTTYGFPQGTIVVVIHNLKIDTSNLKSMGFNLTDDMHLFSYLVFLLLFFGVPSLRRSGALLHV